MDTTNIFTVTPMNQNLELEAGKTYTGSIIVANPANAAADFHYKVSISPYSVVGENYTVNLISTSGRSEITNWIKIENPTGVLKPNETVEVKYTITVPETAPAGGQYAALTVGSNKSISASNGLAINNVFEMASIIYAEVAGDTVHAGKVSEISAPGFITGMPITATATVTNDGNVHEIARIVIDVTTPFSATPVYSTASEDGIASEVIMPETTRLITKNIDGLSPVGIYHVKETINYLGENTVFTQTVVSCPIWFMALVLVTIIAIIVAIIRMVKTRRARRKIF